MKRILALALTVAFVFSGSSLFAATPRAQQSSIAGTSTATTGEPMAGLSVQLRDLSTGQVVQTKVTNEKGEYVFDNLPAGNYAVEALSGTTVIGTSASISLAAGQALTGVVLQANAALLGAAGAAGAAGGAAGAGKGVSAAVMIMVAAGTAYIGAKTNGSNSSSPSR